jgi:hypothetical protein
MAAFFTESAAFPPGGGLIACKRLKNNTAAALAWKLLDRCGSCRLDFFCRGGGSMRQKNTASRRRSSIGWSFCAGLICLLPLAVVHAATWSVCPKGCQFAAVQAGVNRAAPGDVVNIGKGTYF